MNQSGNTNLPEIVDESGFDFSWDVRKVWELNEKVEPMNISELEWHFDVPFVWEYGINKLTPNEIMKNPELHEEEYKRTMAVNLDYPIDIMENKGKWLILDGLHRLMKSKILGHQTVQVRVIPRSRIPEIRK